MYRFKRSLIALMGVLTLVVIVTVSVPHIGRGASGANAPTSQTQSVNVVNTPNVAAQQSGTWNVGVNGTVTVSNFPATSNVAITGTPSVGLDAANNTVKIDSSTPVSVRDINNSAKQPYGARCDLVLPFGQVQVLKPLTTVPAGKILVIEDVSLSGAMSADEKLLYGAIVGDGPASLIVPSDQGPDAFGRHMFVGGRHVSLYFTEGTLVQCFVERSSAATQPGAGMSLFGYFLDAQ
jgi:hypothetical protein